jgi:hypothetical protein
LRYLGVVDLLGLAAVCATTAYSSTSFCASLEAGGAGVCCVAVCAGVSTAATAAAASQSLLIGHYQKQNGAQLTLACLNHPQEQTPPPCSCPSPEWGDTRGKLTTCFVLGYHTPTHPVLLRMWLLGCAGCSGASASHIFSCCCVECVFCLCAGVNAGVRFPPCTAAARSSRWPACVG